MISVTNDTKRFPQLPFLSYTRLYGLNYSAKRYLYHFVSLNSCILHGEKNLPTHQSIRGLDAYLSTIHLINR